jgi:hypothetical protein
MKKLLLVLLVVALASFLFVGCIPSVPDGGEGEEGEAEICPTVAVTTQVAVGTKTYIKGGAQTITVTFAVPTEPISVYVGKACNEKALPDGVPDDSLEVIMYTTDNLTYTGTFTFSKAVDCCEGIIYVVTCNTCAPCKESFIIDNEGPASQITITSSACVCAGCNLIFKTPASSTVCGVTTACCGDYCSGFGSYAIDLYASDPFNLCCDIPCITPAYSCPGGVACPVDCTIACVTGTTTTTDKKYWMVATLLDKVGNKTRYYATIELDSACKVTVTEYPQNKIPTGGTVAVCTDWTGGVVGATIGDCLVVAQ